MEILTILLIASIFLIFLLLSSFLRQKQIYGRRVDKWKRIYDEELILYRNAVKYKIKKTMEVNTILAALSAVMQAVQIWNDYRDKDRTARMLREVYLKELTETKTIEESQSLIELLPNDVLQSLIDRINRCWKDYDSVLQGEYLPPQIERATKQVQQCICRELKTIQQLNGRIPPGKLSLWWKQYCLIEE